MSAYPIPAPSGMGYAFSHAQEGSREELRPREGMANEEQGQGQRASAPLHEETSRETTSDEAAIPKDTRCRIAASRSRTSATASCSRSRARQRHLAVSYRSSVGEKRSRMWTQETRALRTMRWGTPWRAASRDCVGSRPGHGEVPRVAVSPVQSCIGCGEGFARTALQDDHVSGEQRP